MKANTGTFILLALACALLAGCGGSTVQWRTEAVELPWYTSEPQYKAGKHVGGAMFPQPGSQKREGTRTFETVVLENRYLEVQVIPEVGGAVYRAIYKPTGEDLFFQEKLAKDWLPYWESGVKAAFPFREHCTELRGQEASWRIVQNLDGSVSLAIWMEFSRHNQPWQSCMFAHYSTTMLTQIVTLRPDEGLFSVTYRIVNPTPYRQGRRCWTDAFFPRFHTSDGIVSGMEDAPGPTTAEWVFPAAWVSHHGGRDLRRYSEADTAIRPSTQPHNSVFAWDMREGFAGAWYPGVGVNRLRIWDPDKAPGAKQYYRGEGLRNGESPDKPSPDAHQHNFLELWGATDSVMEGVENWIGPGEAFSFTHHYAYLRGIGKVSFANRDAAVHASPSVIEVITFRPRERIVVSIDGKTVGQGPCAPDRPLTLPVDSLGKVVVSSGDEVLIDRKLPLEISADTSKHALIKEACTSSPEPSEKVGEQSDWGRSVSRAVNAYPANSTGRGRLLYRTGQIDAAIETLRAAAQAGPDREAWYLLGVALLEKGDRINARRCLESIVRVLEPYPPAVYWLAVIDIGESQEELAESRLKMLIKKNPAHWEARLLLAWLAVDRGGAPWVVKELEREDPADPRVAWIGTQLRNEEEATRYRENLWYLQKEAGATARVEQFAAATEGRLVHPARLQSPSPTTRRAATTRAAR